MGPHLEKLVNMHTLDLARTRCDVLRRWLLLVFDMLWYVCIVRSSQWHRCCRSCGSTSGEAGEHAYAGPCSYALRCIAPVAVVGV